MAIYNKSIRPTSTTLQVSTDLTFAQPIMEKQGEYRLEQTVNKDELPYGKLLYARMKHSSTIGDTKWSNPVKFRIEAPADIIGVCFDQSVLPGQFRWIDASGDLVDDFDFTKHAVYNNIKMVNTDMGRGVPVSLTAFPKFYIKTALSGPGGSYSEGKKCWWISDLPQAGYRVHPAFKRSTTKKDGTYVTADWNYLSTYLCHEESVGGLTILGSKKGQKVRANITLDQASLYIKNRNNDKVGETGYRDFDIWDLSLLRWLLIIGKANANMQSVWGDNINQIELPVTGSTNVKAIFKGDIDNPTVFIADLYRCYAYWVSKIFIKSGVVSLVSPMSSDEIPMGTNTTKYTLPTSSGWITDILDTPITIGDDTHDVMELFLPKRITSSEKSAAFTDYFERNSETSTHVLITGGNWSSNQSGLFYHKVSWDNSVSKSYDTGVRLAKN